MIHIMATGLPALISKLDAAVGDGHMNITHRRQRTHHREFIQRHGPESQCQPIQSDALNRG